MKPQLVLKKRSKKLGKTELQFEDINNDHRTLVQNDIQRNNHVQFSDTHFNRHNETNNSVKLVIQKREENENKLESSTSVKLLSNSSIKLNKNKQDVISAVNTKIVLSSSKLPKNGTKNVEILLIVYAIVCLCLYVLGDGYLVTIYNIMNTNTFSSQTDFHQDVIPFKSHRHYNNNLFSIDISKPRDGIITTSSSVNLHIEGSSLLPGLVVPLPSNSTATSTLSLTNSTGDSSNTMCVVYLEVSLNGSPIAFSEGNFLVLGDLRGYLDVTFDLTHYGINDNSHYDGLDAKSSSSSVNDFVGRSFALEVEAILLAEPTAEASPFFQRNFHLAARNSIAFYYMRTRSGVTPPGGAYSGTGNAAGNGAVDAEDSDGFDVNEFLKNRFGDENTPSHDVDLGAMSSLEFGLGEAEKEEEDDESTPVLAITQMMDSRCEVESTNPPSLKAHMLLEVANRVLKGVREEDNVRMLMTLHAANSEEIHMDISTVVYEQLYETVTQTKLADAPSDMVHSFPRLFRKYASRRYNGKEVSSSAILSLSGLTTQRPISVSVYLCTSELDFPEKDLVEWCKSRQYARGWDALSVTCLNIVQE